ncbi:hypothetical protein NSE01_26260 [Novosphingobium sediminis]|uniref:Uncharacterized protein n=1 Tax=Novosphingobium sediminis TaxID=707214 RepID=A0A512AM86_9SPHN|nr:hypothetical protein [Novosphingobium sediminis]GEO00794.1 hypothetical protein NSE01_26260 [Novosphingobium sediminis]
MSEPKPFASLSPSLLARKGAARPAMRPQLLPLTAEDRQWMGFGAANPGAEPQFDADDLGWNDHGEDAAPAAPVADVVALAADPLPEPSQPEVLRQIEALADVLKVPGPAASLNRRERGTALKEGRKAAFTLRLDAARHLRLRLACTLDNRSAQALVIEALDRYLEAKPGLDDLARRALRN